MPEPGYVDVESAPTGFLCRRVHTEGYGWLMLLCPDDQDLWLCFGSTPFELDAVTFQRRGQDDEMRRVCALLGMPWDRLEADLLRTTLWQQECLRRMPRGIWRKLEEATFDEILDWRQDVEHSTPGELLASSLTNTPLGAMRN